MLHAFDYLTRGDVLITQFNLVLISDEDSLYAIFRSLLMCRSLLYIYDSSCCAASSF